ncbi:tetratricopeptide repeat protein [Streptomyces sp. Edi2]|uniref:tetratricopeptide repeat protein n=1 Tax=Streptomyces sp. Edi2 TaxID=3162528 RepID=UPI0033058596
MAPVHALRHRPCRPEPLPSRGFAYRLAGRYEEALADFNRAIELDADSGWAHYEKAVALYAAQDPACEVQFAHTVEVCTPASSESTAEAATDVAILFLVHCFVPDWGKAEGYLADFLSRSPAPGQISELLVDIENLRILVPSVGEHLPLFRDRLQSALREPR